MGKKSLVWVTGAAVLVALLLIGVQLASQRAPRAAQALPQTDYSGLPVTATSIGNANAPVLVEEYFDFQCPHCQVAADEVVAPLIEKYVRTGKIRFAYRFYPILGAESVYAARAGYCAAAEGAFWPYQKILFDKRGTGNRGTYSKANLIAAAGEVGLDQEAFRACLESDAARDYVGAEYEKALKLRLDGTPSYVVNGNLVSVPTLAAIEQAIQQALGE